MSSETSSFQHNSAINLCRWCSTASFNPPPPIFIPLLPSIQRMMVGVWISTLMIVASEWLGDGFGLSPKCYFLLFWIRFRKHTPYCSAPLWSSALKLHRRLPKTIRNFSISRSTLSVLIIKLDSPQSMRKTTLASVTHTDSYKSEVGENIQLTFPSPLHQLSPVGSGWWSRINCCSIVTWSRQTAINQIISKPKLNSTCGHLSKRSSVG